MVSTITNKISSDSNAISDSPPPETVKVKKWRKQYDFAFKMDIIKKLESKISPTDAAFNSNIEKSLVTRWL